MGVPPVVAGAAYWLRQDGGLLTMSITHHLSEIKSAIVSRRVSSSGSRRAVAARGASATHLGLLEGQLGGGHEAPAEPVTVCALQPRFEIGDTREVA